MCEVWPDETIAIFFHKKIVKNNQSISIQSDVHQDVHQDDHQDVHQDNLSIIKLIILHE